MFYNPDYSDIYNLQRFLNAQDSTYATACAELTGGTKHSHWMWFVFPQFRGLGYSSMAQRFAIGSVEEAIEYLDHPVLGCRLRECTSIVNGLRNRSALDIFGHPDNLKFRSSMTLFDEAAGRAGHDRRIFAEAIARYFDGKTDPATCGLLHPVKNF